MACVFNFDALNEMTGEVSNSELWQELKDFTKSHTAAKVYYGIATDPEFLSLVQDQLFYNAQGEPTLESLLEAMGRDYNKEQLRQTIQRTIGSQSMDFSKAIYSIQSYNKLNSNSQFMLSFSTAEGNKVRLEVVDNNVKNRAALINSIKKRSYLDRIMFYMRNAGFDVKFLENSDGTMFSPENAETNAEGLLELIKMSREDSTKRVREDLSEQCGHLIINALPSDKLVERLQAVIESEDFIDDFLKHNPEFEDTRFSTSQDQWKMIAGYLIGKQLNNEVDTRNTSFLAKFFKKVGNLINRIISNAINKFKKIPDREYLASLKQAELTATEIAQGFMSPEFNGNVDDILASDDSFSKGGSNKARSISTNVRIAKKILDTLNDYVQGIKGFDEKLYRQLQKELSTVEGAIDFSQVRTAEDYIMDDMAMVAVVKAVQMLIGNYTNTIEKVAKIDFNEEADFVQNMGKHAKTINTTLLYVQAGAIISDIISTYTVDASTVDNTGSLKDFTEVEMESKYGGVQTVNLKELNDKLKALIGNDRGGMVATIQRQQHDFVKRFLSEIIGPGQITRADRVLFKQGSLSTYVEDGFTMDTPEYVTKLLDTLGSDISWWSKSFRSMSNNPDIIGQAFDKVCKVTKMRANAAFLEDRNELLQLLDQAKANNINFDRLVERDEYGPTGYIKQQLDWGRWHRDFQDMVEAAKEEFTEKYGKRKLNTMRDAEKAVLWHKFFNERYKKWHKENSDTIVERNADGKITKWINKPKDTPNKYHSDSYSELSDKERAFIDRYMEIKARLDSKLPEGSTETARLPQMLGSKLNQYSNRRLLGQSMAKAVASTAMQEFCDLFSRTANDTDYGSDRTINKPDALHDGKTAEDNKLERVPLFYINLLPKEKRARMTTDIIGSTMAYAAMANQYSYLSQIKDAMQLSQEQLKKRRIGDKHGVYKEDSGSSNAYKRVTSFMEKELYGLQFNTKMSRGREIVAKIVQMSSSMASRLFLGGNVQGGLANLNMGMSEVLKEAFVGQFFGKKEWLQANKEYFGWDKSSEDYSFMHHNLLVDSLQQIKRNKVNMFAEYFDVFGDNSREFRSYDFRNEKLETAKKADIFYHNAFMPYATGDHYMQLIPFIALAKATKLYHKKDGKVITTNVYDIYKRFSGEGEGVSSKGMFGVDPSILYAKDNADVETVEALDSFINDLTEHVLAIKRGFSVFDTEKHKDIMQKFNFEVDNREDTTINANTLATARGKLRDLTWGFEDEANFKIKAREIGNRMHGIYNQQDKVEMQQNILGNMVLAMRGYALGMVERRWGGDHYSLALGTDSEGSELTNAKVICSLFGDNGVTFDKVLSMQFLPLFKPMYVKSMMEQLGFSETQFYNMKRHEMDWMVILSCVAAVGGFLSVFGYKGFLGRDTDDDPKDYYPNNDADFAAALAYYFVSRLYIESAAYNELMSFTQVEGPSVLSLLGSNIAALNALYQILQGFVEGDYEKGDFKGQNKGVVRASKFIPYFRTYQTVLHDPRKSAQAFELNRGSYGKK